MHLSQEYQNKTKTTLGAANGTYTLDETLKNSFETGHELSKKNYEQ